MLSGLMVASMAGVGNSQWEIAGGEVTKELDLPVLL